jgi:hypothetical protein
MAGKVYFGNDQKQVWINAPQSGMKASSAGYISEQQLLSGSTFVRRSDASHRRFEMSWVGSINAPNLEDSLQVIKDFSDGLYGNSKLFWNDPYATTSNLFSPAWAAPFMSIETDWEAIFPDAAPVTKEVVTTASISGLVGANTQGYPAQSARFTAAGAANAESDRVTFYIPAGYTLWLGFHGQHGVTGAVRAQPYKNGATGTLTTITPLGVNSSTRVNISFSSTVADKVEFYLAKIATASCTFNISGLIAQILPTGTFPQTGGFLSGKGTTGLQFASFPEIEYYSANINDGQIGMSATFAEA